MYNVINEMEFKIVQTATWILLLCSFCNGVPVQTGISDSFLVVGQKEFYFSLIIKTNYFSAAHFCKINGMELASVDSQQENDAIVKYIQKSAFNKDGFWTSGNDLGEEGKFFWLATGKPFAFTNWYANEPNNGGSNEHCVIYWNPNSAGYSWNDVPCNLSYYFICQQPRV